MAEYFKLYRNQDRTGIVETVDDTGELATFEVSPNEVTDGKTLYAIGDNSTDYTKDYGFSEIQVTAVGDDSGNWEFRETSSDSWSNSITITGIDSQTQSFEVRASAGDEVTQADTSDEIEITAEMVVV